MDARSPLFQQVASALIGVLLLNPVVSVAAELTVDAAAGGNTLLTQAANGVPIVNIATPNGNGLSHNRFTDYNVGQQGLILNNASSATQSTQLGGIILGNSNLHGHAAGLILNEVTGASQSQLNGYTEVAGQGAHVIVANPHGITCDGCGFINTPHATLTTGKPVVSNGQLQHYDVDGGEIRIEGAGLNAGNTSQFDLITRSASLNAELHARQLHIITGRNQVDASTLAATAKTDDGSAPPQLAIDSSALGGMYAGAIRLVGTEAGVGVNLAGDMAASAGDIRIDANGQLSLARTAASGDLLLDAQRIDLDGDSYAGGEARLNATDEIYIAPEQHLEAASDVRLAAQLLENRGSVTSGRDQAGALNPASALRIEADKMYNQGQITAHGALAVASQTADNRGGTLVGSQAVVLDVTELDNRDGKIIAQQTLSLNGSNLDNRNGTLASNQALRISMTGSLDNSVDGLLFSKTGGLGVAADQVNNAGGIVQTDQGVLALTANSLNNQSGSLQTGAGAVFLSVAGIDNQNGTLLASGGDLASNGVQLNNQQGWVQGDSLHITTSDGLNNNSGSLLATSADAQLNSARTDNADGQILAQGNLLISGGSLNNQHGTLGAQVIDLTLTDALGNSGGLIEASDRLLLRAADVDNDNAQLRALGEYGESRIQVQNHFANNNGMVEIGNAGFTLSSASLSNQQGNVLHLGEQGFALNVANLDDVGGSFITNSDFTLNAANWSSSSLLQARNLTLSVDHFSQGANGQLIATNSFSGSGVDWYSDGLLASDGGFNLNLSGDYSGYGTLTSLGDMRLSALDLKLAEGVHISSGGSALLDIAGSLYNEGGFLTAVDSLRINAGQLENHGTIGSAGSLLVNARSLFNQGLLFSGAGMALFSDHLSNLYGDIYSLGDLAIAKNAVGEMSGLLENRSGSIESAGDMHLRASLLENRKETFALGREQTSGSISMVCLDCSGDHFNVDFIATERFSLSASEDSSAARIYSGGDLDIFGEAVTNRYSSLSATGALSISSNTLNNLGAEAGVIEHSLRVNTGRTNDGDVVRLLQNYVNPYNSAPLPKSIPDGIARMPLVSEIETFSANGLLAPAVIQAGGAVTIQADQGLSNGSISPFSTPMAGSDWQINSSVSANQRPLQVRLNPQLPADLGQQAVNPLSLPGFSLPSGHGLFQFSQNPDHPYLIETSPAFANLKNFLNSDYLLGRLGYDSNEMQRRLGDGLYEQRLIQQAIIARTGERFIAGLASDEDMFRYLMDNAIASKEELQLSVGVALSAEQIAALTHDIVWMESQPVNGQQVLVPVLYLAQANNRLAPSGALIQGQDLALISGGNLGNSGTLRASHNLSATANRISNSGLMQANERLSLLAMDSIHNAQGGIINGQNVSAIALTGDISNERSVSQQLLAGRGFSQLTSVVDNAARIESGQDLDLSAGGNIRNIGGALSAAGNASLYADGSVIIASATEEQAMMREDKRHAWENSSTTQHASEVQVGNNLQVDAGQNLAIIASSVKAGGDINLTANGDVSLTAAANQSSSEYHYKRSDKQIDMEDRHVTQQAAVIEGGGDLVIVAGHDLDLVASQLDAAEEAYLYAGNQLNLLVAQNSDYHLYNYEKDGGTWGSSKTQRDETTRINQVGSILKTGGDLTLASDGDQTYQRARLDSGSDLTLNSGGAISFEAVSDLKQESHEQSSNNLAWTSSKGKGQTDETLLQSQLLAQGKIAINAVEGLHIDIKQINKQSVSQTIDAMVKAEPQLAWLKDAEARGDVDWQRVQEIHDSFKYNNSGLGQGAAIALAIFIAATTSGAVSAAIGNMAGATAGSGSIMAAASTTAVAGFGNVAATAVVTSAAATAAVSAVNNRGNLGQVLEDTTSSDSLRNYAVAGAIAGFTAYTDGWGREVAGEGNLRTVSYSERLNAYVANTTLKGMLSGEDNAKSWLTIAGTGAMMELYQDSVGREPDIRPGVDRPDRATYDESLEFVPRVNANGILREGNNFALNQLCVTYFPMCQGGPISNFINQVPVSNAVATIHDSWLKGLGNGMSDLVNYGTMIPAGVVSYGALYDKYRVLSGVVSEKK